MKKIIIDWYCYEKDGRSCPRCGESYQAILRAVEELSSSLREQGIAIDLLTHGLDEDRREESNTVVINGKEVTAMLKERDGIFSYCRSCTELTGRPTECRTFIYRSRAYESVPEEMIREAILKEAAS